ncbi:1,4-alpha-glucan branching enzyme [Streptoalloteichus tenebrarius]|uniref:1,4-alpha-glucan branching enzyme GlgB n=1 Tax=Streptoalloteichus tenebrarius (strain ATCC 17920 / DSM 40477 / JCM 4838 / CBS 697.72 / NBRC 16177 / NCIMB 11028 / NRRL B-12390 / A12253. 1 / ISP 5477) TaxID=1933 RepID=A0ABT1HWJ3_STRSD|nr:1,4-alpha-glucan branching protein GlgB [Streptoalloteichus tenebrarius]MCP2259887.1 1,4-alpha-glucan branching enzyme [Streptoalloteichus tenebrarius]BFF03210.1 1,4-alpha-glucan branching protein GlgB [Streptoalloteichus tenebrarius]
MKSVLDTVDTCPPDGESVDRLVSGSHHDPHSVLGAHPHPDGMVVRVFRPHADAVTVVLPGGGDEPERRCPLPLVDEAGLFSGVVPAPPGDYRLEIRYGEHVETVDDPYRWLPTLGDLDLHLIAEGRHERLWEALGAHERAYETEHGTVSGVAFAVWAPNARGVRLCGDFDFWDGRAFPLRSLGSSGIWELFVPDLPVGTRYKFRVLGPDGHWHERSDPMAFAAELPPATASVVTTSGHVWHDDDWMTRRASAQWWREPVSIYEVHLGSWRQGTGYREIAHELADYVDRMGFTHVELLPVAEHPFGGSWGYQVTSYYAPTARYGTPDDFRYFVDHLHQRGIGVLLDWVPAHFPRDEWALARFDGTPLYEHADPRRGEHPDWGTLVFNLGRTEVRNFLIASALYWLDEFHLDGLRVDAVASMLYLDYSREEGEWVPNPHGGREDLEAIAFLRELNATAYRRHPGIMMVAEESTAWTGVTRRTDEDGLGFGFKWNMGWMHDTLEYLRRDPVHRSYHHNEITFSMLYAWSENYILPLSHDEVVHGKGSLWERMPGDAWNKAAGVRALLAYMWAHPGKQLLFMGGEFGQPWEWSAATSLAWHLLDEHGGMNYHRGIQRLVGVLNSLYREHPALYTLDTSPEGFEWIDGGDAARNLLSFLRRGDDGSLLVCVVNFAGIPHHEHRLALPLAGRWRELLNTDEPDFGGSGVGNGKLVTATAEPHLGRPASAVVDVPPLGVLWLVPDGQD